MMTRSDRTSAVDRRTVVGGIATGAIAAAGANFAQAQPAVPGPSGTPAATKAAGRTGETLARLGLGTFLTFDAIPGAKRDAFREVTRIYVEAGVRVVDTSPLYGTAETSVGNFLSAMNVADQMFIANKVWSTGDFL